MKKIRTKDIINVDDCKVLADKYLKAKDGSKINPQPDKSSQTRISNCVNDQLIHYPFKTLATFKLVEAVIRYTWGYRGIAEKEGYTKYGVAISEPELAEACNITEAQLLAAIKEAEKANILVVIHNKGKKIGPNSYLTNYYMFNKHYDRWIGRYSGAADSSPTDSSPTDRGAMDRGTVDRGTVDSTPTDGDYGEFMGDAEMGVTKYLPIREGAKVELVGMIGDDKLNKIAKDATLLVLSIGGSQKMYEGLLFKEAHKIIGDGK